MSESKRTAPRWYCVDRDGVAMLCANRRDALAQAAENDDCWPQRAPYQAVLLGDVSALAAEVERLKAENDKLRAKLGNSPEPCAYCGIPADRLLECRHGFPGCPRADDMVLCGHFGAAMEAAEARKDLADERRKVEALREPTDAMVYAFLQATGAYWKFRHPSVFREGSEHEATAVGLRAALAATEGEK